ncbi:hypothetical protein BAUCODRAFT_80415 [Baudoinia panamericana UAMH 10762]|uniref:ARM repeat-containing protein n=1 Tax=Baudoinia panamericana (strain UAMH 10762) TaxID=717646 RepID=M2M486_BAUPA|nr:uncharacterized protein BAUCODRAFT_80415 [Baudoinia panamericana UAMH 10762]EMC91411.1 hypothetical protein BAUCODRAFT_80415 [Baudoinia panamericana UAMH 10762]
MSASSQSPEQRELALIDKVELRIALADSDAKLETILKTYLAPLLLKLASEHNSVRQKVVSVCQHVSTRIKPKSIQLPVAALVKQFKEQQGSLVRYFDLVYIQQGVDRLSTVQQREVLPLLLSGISDSGSHAPQIFNLMLRLLESFDLPPRGSKDDGELRSKCEVTDNDANFLATWLGKFMLFVPKKGTSTMCPGLNAEDYAFLNLQGKEGLWHPAEGGLNLLRTKVLVARLLSSGLFHDEERFFPALFASADAASNFSDVGDDMLKRVLPAISLEDEATVTRLFGLFFGENGAVRVAAPLRLKILGLLNKSERSTTFSNYIVKIVEDGIALHDIDGEDVVIATAGRELTKLRSAIFQYVNFVARHGSEDTLHAIAQKVILSLRDFIENQGWPNVGPNEDLVSRGYGYEVIGLLAKAGPRAILVESEHPTMDLLRWLLDSLARDTSGSSIIVSIEEALSHVLGALARMQLSLAEQSVLEDLLIDQLEQSEDLGSGNRLRSTRYVSVRFANRCLPYHSSKARWIDILALGATSDRAEVREEAERGLSPYWYRMLNGSPGVVDAEHVSFPTFEAIIAQFFRGHVITEKRKPKMVVHQTMRAYPRSFDHMTAFARRILYREAVERHASSPSVDTEWERRVDAAVESDPKARDAVKSYVRELSRSSSNAVEILLFALFEAVMSPVVAASTPGTLVDFLAVSPNALTEQLAQDCDLLTTRLQGGTHSRRTAAAHAFGILCSHPAVDSSKARGLVENLLDAMKGWETAVGAAVNSLHGKILALGFYYSRAAVRGQFPDNDHHMDQFKEHLVSILIASRDKALQEASQIALGQLCMFGALSLDSLSVLRKPRSIVDKLYEAAKTGNETAVLSMGQMSMIFPEAPEEEADDDLTYLTEQLHKLHELREAEAHFSVGEAFSCLASGWQSTALTTKLDVETDVPQSPARLKTLGRVMDRFLTDCRNTKPSLKKAAVMWLLCLVQFCGQLPDVQSRLAQCQTAFKRCLGDRDELIQETASRGLGLIYEKGDRKLKDDLVRDLVSSFSSDRQSQLAGNVSAETQLFEPGALPTGDGSVSTYKDIMSLASEVGDSSLVYRFMSMASSNAIWSSRAAFGRFGLSSVLSDSSVDGYLANHPKLYPKLYRYRFDPNSGVQRSMNDIWNALVKDPTATIDRYFDDIMEDLLDSILGKEWRVRQASCAAVGDLVQGRPLQRYEGYLERIWTQCFRVLDDIKESVRAAAASLARVLTGILLRALEADHSSTKNASAMLKHVLPFLLSSSGMESSAKEVQAFSVHTLLEIIKKANGATLRPFIPELVERLLGSLSSLEPEAVNYIHLNAAKYNLTEQKIDDMRLSSIRSSPLMEAIERCLDLLDDSAMQQLQPKLEGAIKGAVGLPSKVGASRVLVSLSTRRVAVFRPYSDSFLRLVEKVVLDRNETVSGSYAVAAGYLARAATEKQVLHLIAYTKKLYFESEGDRESTLPRRSLSAGEIVYAVCKHATDRFNAAASSVLPFVFLAKHDPHEQVKEQFQNAWNETVGGSRTVMLLYLREIVNLSNAYLESPQWVLKHTSARAIADAVNITAALESHMTQETAEMIWPALEKALGGKTWEGKEVVLSAFEKFVESAGAFTQSDSVAQAIVKVRATYVRSTLVSISEHCRSGSHLDTARCETLLIETTRLPCVKQNVRTPPTSRMLWNA